MLRRTWLAISLLFALEIWMSASYFFAGNPETGWRSTFWVLVTVFIIGKVHWFEKLDSQGKPA
jgi:hypothetical protein